MRTRILAWLCVLAAPLSAQSSYDGRPSFSAANSAGYYLWRDKGVWHLRWVSLDRVRRFEGQVTVNEGTIRLLSKIDANAEMEELYPGRVRLPYVVARTPADVRDMTAARPRITTMKRGDSTVSFDSDPENSLQGIDFTVSDGASGIWLSLTVDHKSNPTVVWIGRGNSNPEELPFILPLK